MTLSVIVPSFQRRALVVRCVEAIGRTGFRDAEVIVVVDGSSDGTAAALRGVSIPMPLRVVEQPNRGAAAARNAGARLAAGDVLCFLDDDMEAEEALFEEHAKSFRAGADAVVGHIPLHPASPQTFLTAALSRSVEHRRARLAAPGARMTPFDILTGQLAVRKVVFEAVGGFDGQFTAAGRFGDEDIDFGCRLLDAGYRVDFNEAAVSRQLYVVTPEAHLRQWSNLGAADVAFARKHPAHAATLFAFRHADERYTRRIVRPLAAVPLLGGLAVRAGTAALSLLTRWRPRSARTITLFSRVRALMYWRSVWRSGGVPAVRPVRVLAYHAIADLPDDAASGTYAVAPRRLRRHLSLLTRLGAHFISVTELARMVRGEGGVPRRAVLLTFDDGYADVIDVAKPLLDEFHAPALAFIVTGCVGRTNTWDQRAGGPAVPLASAAALRLAVHAGLELGVHTRTHPRLPRLPAREARDEIAGAIGDLERLGLPRSTVFAYPYGEHDAAVRAAAAASGVSLAFTLGGGLAARDADPLRLPRTEITRRDQGLRFLWKVWRMPGAGAS
jgi:peptidoglycan/xylan/chitin deacetylase (PgdA/CDA1 family)/glycosyltransferase involved in cell wall biosynthesis